MKKCSKCEQEKPLDQFYKQAGCKDGHRPDCKVCVTGRVMRLHYADHEKSKARLRASQAKHRGRRLLDNREYYRRNRDALMKAVARWAKKNRQKVYSYQHNWRANKRAGGKHTSEEIARLLTLQKSKCAVCKCSIKKLFHRDHVVPLKSGGSNDISNIQLLCPSCNTSKGAKHPLEFLRSRGFLL